MTPTDVLLVYTPSAQPPRLYPLGRGSGLGWVMVTARKLIRDNVVVFAPPASRTKREICRSRQIRF